MSQDRSPWPAITFIGVLCGVALGAIFILLLRKQRTPAAELGALGDVDSDRLLEELTVAAPPGGWRPSRAGQPPRATHLPPMRVVPVARTMRISSTEPTLLLKAVGTRDWKVFVRVIGPPGSSASFMLSNSPSDSIDLEGGDFQDMRIPRGEFLYAQGNIANVSVSASGGPES